MRITVRRIGRIQVDHQAAGRSLADALLKHMKERLASRVDVNDRPFAPYSPLYRKSREAIGEGASTTDLKDSGGMLASLRVLRIEQRGGRTLITIGVDNGTSPRRPRPPPWVFAGTAEENAAALERWRRAPKKTEPPLTHAHKLSILVRGTKHSPPRRALGVSPRGRGPAVKALEKARIFRS